MDIKEIKQHRRQLENELATMIAQRLKAFKDTTGVPVRDVFLYFGTVGTFEEEDLDYVLTGIKCEIAI